MPDGLPSEAQPLAQEPTRYGSHAWPRSAFSPSCAAPPSAPASGRGLAQTLGCIRQVSIHHATLAYIADRPRPSSLEVPDAKSQSPLLVAWFPVLLSDCRPQG